VDGLKSVQKVVNSDSEGASELQTFSTEMAENEIKGLITGSDNKTKDSAIKNRAAEVVSKNLINENREINKGSVQGINVEAQKTVPQSNLKDIQKTVLDANEISEFTMKTKIKTENVNDSKSGSAPPVAQEMVDGAKIYSTTKSSQINEPARLAEAPKNEVIKQISEQLDGLMKSNKSSLRMQLYPEELGHIDLKIVSSKGGVAVTLIADKTSTQQVLQSEMNSLRQTIEQAGIQLNNLNIGQEQTSNKQQFDGRQHFLKHDPDTKQEAALQARSDRSVKNIYLSTTEIDYRI
jgi:flagellar hook-length control protein FliK